MENEKIMIKDEITISKENILSQYNLMNDYFKNIIELLYSGESTTVNYIDFNNIEEEFINSKCDKLSKKYGIYIFLNNNNIPVYIGKSTTLKKRLTNQIRGKDNAVLSKNIQDIERILQNRTITKKESLDYINSFKLKVIIVDVEEKENIIKSLEQLLIALFNSKYNK